MVTRESEELSPGAETRNTCDYGSFRTSVNA